MAKKAFFVDSTGPYRSTGFSFAVHRTATLSGTVVDSQGDPLVRKLYLFKQQDIDLTDALAKTPYATTTSNSYDGGYAFTLHDNNLQEWIVMCIGEGDEPTQMLSRITLPA